MTLDGTNTYVIQAPGSSGAVVVDPGPEIAAHLESVESLGPIELVLLTHCHFDHTESRATIAAHTGAPVRALDPAFCVGGDPLRPDEEIEAGGVRLSVLATPGHSADSVCFHLPDDTASGADAVTGSMLTGDTILGRGTSIIAKPDGTLHDYLASLEILRDFAGAELVLPAHGPVLPSLTAVAEEYIRHRLLRLRQVRDALDLLGIVPSSEGSVVTRVTDFVYPNIHRDVRFAAEAATYAQLRYLEVEHVEDAG